MNIYSIGHQQAQTLLTAATAEAQKQNLPVAIAVVDTGGHVVAFMRLDGTSYAANDISRRKAIAACNYKAPTQVLFDMANNDPIMANALREDPDTFIFPGGLPLMNGAHCVGGLGISGGHYTQDQKIAEAALAAWAQISA
jgi:glc operon protein GlcG